MTDPYVHLRQIATPSGNPQTGGNLFYFKSDGKAYFKDASGNEVAFASSADLAAYLQKANNLSDLTNPATARANLGLGNAATQSVSGAVVGTTDTQTLTNKDLSSATNIFPAAPNIQIFTASGTWTKPTGAKYVVIEMVGGGGAGGGATATAAGQCATGGGGGGGGYSKSTFLAGAVGATETITVGAGAIGSTGAGATGGTSSFGAILTATGGSGGSQGTAVAPPSSLAGQGGAGGSGSGDIAIPGGYGGDGFCLNGARAVQGAGGTSQFSGSSRLLITGTRSNFTGNSYGGGGNGAANAQSQIATAGGDGADGLVVITTYFV